MLNNTENIEAIEILLKKFDDKLTEWEITFLENLYDQEYISEKQQEILDNLWNKCMGLK